MLFIQAAAIAVINKHKKAVVAKNKNDSVANAAPTNTDVASHYTESFKDIGLFKQTLVHDPRPGAKPRYEDSKRSKQLACMICSRVTTMYCVGCGPGKGLCPGGCLAKHIGHIMNA